MAFTFKEKNKLQCKKKKPFRGKVMLENLAERLQFSLKHFTNVLLFLYSPVSLTIHYGKAYVYI